MFSRLSGHGEKTSSRRAEARWRFHVASEPPARICPYRCASPRRPHPPGYLRVWQNGWERARRSFPPARNTPAVTRRSVNWRFCGGGSPCRWNSRWRLAERAKMRLPGKTRAGGSGAQQQGSTPRLSETRLDENSVVAGLQGARSDEACPGSLNDSRLK